MDGRKEGKMKERKEMVNSPSSESQSPLSVLRSDLHANSLFLAGAPAANARTHKHQKTDPRSDRCPTANNTEGMKEGGGEEKGGGGGRFLEKAIIHI